MRGRVGTLASPSSPVLSEGFPPLPEKPTCVRSLVVARYLSKQTSIAFRLKAHRHWQTNGTRVSASIKSKLIIVARAGYIRNKTGRSHRDNVTVFGHDGDIERIKGAIGMERSLFGQRLPLSFDIHTRLCHPFSQANPAW